MDVIKLTICVAAVLVFVDPVYQAHVEPRAASGVWPRNETLRQIVTGKDQVKRIPIAQWSSRKRIGQFFTDWSPWSSCDSKCSQTRERFCRVLRKCANTKHLEERPCSICKEQQQHHSRGGDIHQSTGRHHSSQQTNNNNMSARHNLIESHSNPLDRSADDDDVDGVSNFDLILNKFNPKLRRDTSDQQQMDDSEFHIIKINHKKMAQQRPEIRGNKLDFARPALAVQIINDVDRNVSESDGWVDVEPPTSLYGSLDNNELDDDNYMEADSDYQADDGAGQGKRRYKNGGGQTIKKYTPMVAMAVADPKGAYRVYTRWSKWTKCSGKCTTRRFKRCRMKEICGNEVLREVAYCYTEGSFCEEWIVRQMYSNVPRSPGQMVQQSHYPVDPKPQQSVGNSIQERKLPTRATGAAPGPGQCGIATAVTNRKKPASHLLRIIGGRVVRRGSYPWQVAILNRFKEAFCGGTLINKQWILTAAHCVRKRLYVRLGDHNLEDKDGTEVEYRVEYAIRHPYYDKTTVDNDIALLRLPKEIIPSAYIGFACLPEKYQKLPVGTKCTIIGWGKRKNLDDAGTKYLHEAQVPIVPNEECKKVYDDYVITSNMFCAGHKRGRIDTCSGDSGGPLLCKDPNTSHWSILGVTSFGDGCGKRNKFGIYTKVSNYVDWIMSVIECSGNCRRF